MNMADLFKMLSIPCRPLGWEKTLLLIDEAVVRERFVSWLESNEGSLRAHGGTFARQVLMAMVRATLRKQLGATRTW